jgi:hypothetical protein
MARSRFPVMTVLTVILAATCWQSAWAQSSPGAGTVDTTTVPTPLTSSSPASWAVQITRSVPGSDTTCVVYPLSGFSADPHFAKWVADTIPEVVEPTTWSQSGGAGRVRYHAASQVLVIHQTTAVHAKVETFLKDLKKATPPARFAAQSSFGEVLPEMPRVVQAQYSEPPLAKAVPAVAAAGSSYLVPPPVSQPKHLFHLIIRYEGDGTSDGSVSGLLKDLAAANVAKDDTADKPNTGPVKNSSLNEKLHVIVRYEGDGIIDANVVALLKEYMRATSAKECAPVGSYSGTPPPTTSPAPPAVPLDAAPAQAPPLSGSLPPAPMQAPVPVPQ